MNENKKIDNITDKTKVDANTTTNNVVNPTLVTPEVKIDAPIVTPEVVTQTPTSTPKVVTPTPTPTPEVVTPTPVQTTPSEFNTSKTKNSNTLFYVVIGLLLLVTFFIDDIVNIITDDNYTYYHGSNNESASGNLINGFIKVGENNSYIKYNKIKFYDFKLGSTGTINLTYVSDKNISNTDKLNIYIELYDSNQEIIFKEQFKPENKIENGVVSQYNLYVSNDVYLSTFYAKVLEYTDKELSSTSVVTCTSLVQNDLINVVYKNTFNFTNNELTSYSVSRAYTSTTENLEVEKYKTEIKNEHDEITKYNIKNEYKDNLLTYSIDLSSIPEGYTPIYSYGTIPKTIKNKEKLKKWICE